MEGREGERERERRGRHTGETTYVFGITAINAVSPVCFALDPPTLVQTSIATLFRNQPSVDFIHRCYIWAHPPFAPEARHAGRLALFPRFLFVSILESAGKIVLPGIRS